MCRNRKPTEGPGRALGAGRGLPEKMQVGAVHTPPAACKHVTLPCPYPSLLHWGHLSLPVSLTEPQIVFLFLSVLAPTPVSRLTGTVLMSLFQCSCKRTMRPFIVCCLKLLPWRISEAHKRRLALTKLHAAIAGLNNDRHLAGCVSLILLPLCSLVLGVSVLRHISDTSFLQLKITFAKLITTK